MKFFTVIILTALLGFAAPLYFDWWSFAITSFLIAVILYQHPARAFVAAFFGLFLLWLIDAFVMDYRNQHILSAKVSELLQVPGPIVLLFVTSLVGGLISGFAGWAGSLLRAIFQKQNQNI